MVALVVAVALWKLLAFEAAIQNDIKTQLYPWSMYISDCLRQGELPLWNPFANLGYPLHLDPQARAWFPPVWAISLTFGYSFRTLQVELVLWFVVAALTAYGCARTFRVSRAGAALTALSFALSGAFVGNAQHLQWLVSLALLPLHLLLWRRASTSGSLFDHALLGASLGLVLLGGYPGFLVASSTLVVALLLLGGAWRMDRMAQLALRLAITAASGLLVAAVMVLPLATVGADLTRGHLPLETVEQSSLNPLLLMQAVVPSLAIGGRDFFGVAQPVANLYLGIVTLCLAWLALVGVAAPGDRRDRPFVWTLVIALLLAFGKYGFLRGLAYALIPGYDLFRIPSLFRGYAIFAAAMLAGFALDHFTAAEVGRLRLLRRTMSRLAVVLLFLLLIAFALSLFFAGAPAMSQQRRELGYPFSERLLFWGPLQLLWLALAGAVVERTLRGSLTQRAAAVLLVAVAAADLTTAVQTNFDTVGEAGFDIGAVVERERTRPRGFLPREGGIAASYVSPNVGGEVNDGILERRLQTGAYNPFLLRRTEAFLSVPGHRRMVGLGLLYLSNDVVVVGPEAALGVVGDPAAAPRRVVLDRELAIALPQRPDPAGRAELVGFSANRLEVVVDTPEPTLLVVQQTMFPGWRARLDGGPAPLYTANTIARAVAVPAGRHVVEMRYRPRSVLAGGVVSLLAWLALGGWALARWRRGAATRSQRLPT